MKRIDSDTAVADLHGAGADGFQDSDAATGQLPTHLNADWCNGLQEELMTIIVTEAGLTPDGGDYTQLRDAIFDGAHTWALPQTFSNAISALAIQQSGSGPLSYSSPPTRNTMIPMSAWRRGGSGAGVDPWWMASGNPSITTTTDDAELCCCLDFLPHGAVVSAVRVNVFPGAAPTTTAMELAVRSATMNTGTPATWDMGTESTDSASGNGSWERLEVTGLSITTDHIGNGDIDQVFVKITASDNASAFGDSVGFGYVTWTDPGERNY